MEVQDTFPEALPVSAEDHMRTRVLVLGESRLWIAGLRQVLEESSDFQYVGSGPQTGSLEAVLNAACPAQVVMETGRRTLEQCEWIRAVKAAGPAVQMVVITGESSVPAVTRIVRAGADAILGADIMPDSLLSVLRLLRGGAQFVTSHELWPAVRESIRGEPIEDDARLTALTPRERDVYDLLRQGRSDREIAEILTLSLWTVKHHVVNVLQKLEIKSRRELLRIGAEA